MKKVFNNDAINLQLQLTAEINSLLKSRGVNVSNLFVEVKAFKKKKKKVLKENSDIVEVNGAIKLSFSAFLNPDQKYDFLNEELNNEDELLIS